MQMFLLPTLELFSVAWCGFATMYTRVGVYPDMMSALKWPWFSYHILLFWNCMGVSCSDHVTRSLLSRLAGSQVVSSAAHQGTYLSVCSIWRMYQLCTF